MLQLKAKECFAIEKWLSGERESGWCISGASTQVLMMAATDFPLAFLLAAVSKEIPCSPLQLSH